MRNEKYGEHQLFPRFLSGSFEPAKESRRKLAKEK